MIFDKAELRKVLRERIALLPGNYITKSNTALSLRVTLMPEFSVARNIMMYYSVEREPDTLEIAKIALSKGKTVAFPFCYRGGIMQARIVNSLSQLKPAMLGIPAPPENAPVIAPEDLDLVIVPALTYDKDGFRLGYGGGYYDRYLYEINALTIGLARERLIMDRLPRERHDIAVNRVITEDKTLCLT